MRKGEVCSEVGEREEEGRKQEEGRERELENRVL